MRSNTACPGLFRIVPARDGGICRLRLAFGHVSAPAARAIAGIAKRHTNGVIDITNRANLQLRGVAQDSEAALIAELVASGLGPSRPEADGARNVLVSPTAGIDPVQYFDALPVAAAIDAFLQSDGIADRMNPKFGVSLDAGESLVAIDHPNDIWLATMGDGKVALGIAGTVEQAARGTPYLVFAEADAAKAVNAAIELFLELAGTDPEIRRYRDLLKTASRDEILARLGGELRRDVWVRTMSRARSHVGIHLQRDGKWFLGAVPPLGRLSSTMLEDLAALAETYGNGTLRLTPWQSVVLPGIADPQSAAKAASAAGLIVDPASPLASIVACSGSSGCASALADTKADALAIARDLGDLDGQTVHLTGCAKSCAVAGTADITLQALAPGRYTVFRKDGNDSARFGRCLAENAATAEIAGIVSAA
jgi:precorrin-3B synthase